MSCCQSSTNGAVRTPASQASVEQSGVAFRPNSDIIETSEEFVIRADVPGVKADAIDLRVEEGVLMLKARVMPRMPEGARRLIGEYGVGDFERSFRLGEGVDAQNIAAELKDGVLTLRLPKTAAAKPHAIKIKTA